MASGQFGHHALGFHSAGQHVSMVAVAGYDLIALFQGHLHADDDRLLADVEMAEAADRAHSVELSGLFLKPPDQAACRAARFKSFLFPGEFRRGAITRFPGLLLSRRFFLQ